MMTAADCARKVLVIGAGVADIQAIATAKEQGLLFSDRCKSLQRTVESLGGKFLSVEQSEDMSCCGYAKETSEEYKKKQLKMREALKK